jgi:hypothetical protein
VPLSRQPVQHALATVGSQVEPSGRQVVEDVVLDELLVDELDELVLDELDELVLDELDELLLDELLELGPVDDEDELLVAPMQALLRLNVDTDRHPGPHALPAGQHVVLAPVPQGVVAEGQPHRPRDRSRQAMPPLQHDGPQGVVPAGQQHDVIRSEQDWPFVQQPLPQAGAPAGQASAPPRNGRRTVAPTAAANEAPITLRAPRRDVEVAIALVRSSNRSLMASPVSMHPTG